MSATKTGFSSLLAACSLVAVVVIEATPLAGQAARAVSPGSPVQTEVVAGSCPAFSWSAVGDATGYELVLYRVAENGTLENEFQRRLPAGASSWTPSAASCPQPGANYAWAVRVIGEHGKGRWSEPMLFSTPAKPTDDEVRQALDVLRRHQEAAIGADVAADGPISAIARAESQPTADVGRIGSSGSLAEIFAVPLVGAVPSPKAITAPASFALSLDGDVELGGSVFKEGSPFLHADGGALAFNTAAGRNALSGVTSGKRNSAFGNGALALSTEGGYNTAVGADALFGNTTGFHNAAFGNGALQANGSGFRNAAIGSLAMFFNTTGFHNAALGFQALTSNNTGARNTALGHQAMSHNTTGSLNTAIGYRAGYDWTTGSSNVAVGFGSTGSNGESGVIRIGGGNQQSKTFIEGISATNVSGVNVLITAGDQLGVAASSARFKRDIHDLEGVSDRLQDLRPVSFRYREKYAGDGAESVEYGLIAEEVAEIFPELVVRDEDGRPYTVRYHLLTPLLLAEVQRQQEELVRLRSQLSTRPERRSRSRGRDDHPGRF